MVVVVYGHSSDMLQQDFDCLLKMLEVLQVQYIYCNQQVPTHSGVYLAVEMETSKKLCLFLKTRVTRQLERNMNLHLVDLEKAFELQVVFASSTGGFVAHP